MPQKTLQSLCSLVLTGMAAQSLAPAPNNRSVEAIFNDFSGRRAALLRALTRDADDFFSRCDPGQKGLCLYGLPNKSWEVAFPVEEIPPEIPEPALGINAARDGMARRDWLALLAKHSDSWLMAVAFYFGARLTKSEREHLFDLINDQPTICEVLKEKKPLKRKCNNASHDSKSKNGVKRNKQGKGTPKMKESHDDDKDNICGICEGNYKENEFWVCCASCKRWFHGKCLKLTPAKTKGMKNYKCPFCKNKTENGNATTQETRGEDKDADEDEKDESKTICGICAEVYNDKEFWIVCHSCEGRFHGKCVKITQSKAKRMTEEYTCGFCRNGTKKGNTRTQESCKVEKDGREEETSTMQEDHGKDKVADLDDSKENATCGICGENEKERFWICCDICNDRFHGKCVKLTPAKAEHIKKYKCPSCKKKTEKENAKTKKSHAEEKDKDKDKDEDKDYKGKTICGICAENYNDKEFWIVCDSCDGWFHGKCVKITSVKYKRTKEYRCGFCVNGKETGNAKGSR